MFTAELPCLKFPTCISKINLTKCAFQTYWKSFCLKFRQELERMFRVFWLQNCIVGMFFDSSSAFVCSISRITPPHISDNVPWSPHSLRTTPSHPQKDGSSSKYRFAILGINDKTMKSILCTVFNEFIIFAKLFNWNCNRLLNSFADLKFNLISLFGKTTSLCGSRLVVESRHTLVDPRWLGSSEK